MPGGGGGGGGCQRPVRLRVRVPRRERLLRRRAPVRQILRVPGWRGGHTQSDTNKLINRFISSPPRCLSTSAPTAWCLTSPAPATPSAASPSVLTAQVSSKGDWTTGNWRQLETIQNCVLTIVFSRQIRPAARPAQSRLPPPARVLHCAGREGEGLYIIIPYI